MINIGLLIVFVATLGIVYLLATQVEDKEEIYISQRCGNCKHFCDKDWWCEYYCIRTPPDITKCKRWEWKYVQ